MTDKRRLRYEGNACSSNMRWEKMPNECRDEITEPESVLTGSWMPQEIMTWECGQRKHRTVKLASSPAQQPSQPSWRCLGWVLTDHTMTSRQIANLYIPAYDTNTDPVLWNVSLLWRLLVSTRGCIQMCSKWSRWAESNLTVNLNTPINYL